MAVIREAKRISTEPVRFEEVRKTIQEQILEILEKENRWWSFDELGEMLKLDRKNIAEKIRKLRIKRPAVIWVKIPNENRIGEQPYLVVKHAKYKPAEEDKFDLADFQI